MKSNLVRPYRFESDFSLIVVLFAFKSIFVMHQSIVISFTILPSEMIILIDYLIFRITIIPNKNFMQNHKTVKSIKHKRVSSSSLENP